MNKISFLNPVGPQAPVERNQVGLGRTESGMTFKEILEQNLPQAGVKFSSHCLKRMEQNGIKLSAQQMDKLNGAVEKAGTKGSQEACIVMDGMAFVVSISNRTVITVVDGPRMKDSVFTNIDSAVIL